MMELLFITGMSGAGKTNACQALEDMGYYCIDNIPPMLILSVVDLVIKGRLNFEKIAIVTDFRGGEAFKSITDVFKGLSAEKIKYKVLFLDAADTELERRYHETRRKHPLCEPYHLSVHEAIRKERQLLSELATGADYKIDTTDLTAGQLKKRLIDLLAGGNQSILHITCMSFGFKYGTVNEANLLFDVRCLPNPFYEKELKHHTGLDRDVVDYIMQYDASKQFYQKLCDFVTYSLPLYLKEGKSQLVIAVGCTGGKHRSVAFAQMLYEELKKKNYCVDVMHRDIEKHV